MHRQGEIDTHLIVMVVLGIAMLIIMVYFGMKAFGSWL